MAEALKKIHKILSWKEPKLSLLVFGGLNLVFYLNALCAYPIIQILCYIILASLITIFIYLKLKHSTYIDSKYDFVYREILKDLIAFANDIFQNAYSLNTTEHTILALFILTVENFVSSWFSTAGFVWIVTILAFLVPLAYSLQKEQIGTQIQIVKSKWNKIKLQVKAMIPKARSCKGPLCFKQNCNLDIQYVCLCSRHKTYCCEFHLETHIKLLNKAHTLDSVLLNPYALTKDTILGFLTKEKSKTEKLKKIVFDFTSQNVYNFREDIEDIFKRLDFDIKEINWLIKNTWEINEQIQFLNKLLSESSYEIGKTRITQCSELYKGIKLSNGLKMIKNCKSKILNAVNNNSEIEKYFRKICDKYKNNDNPIISEAYQDLISTYQTFTSIRFINIYGKNDNLLIYNTETETETKAKIKIKILAKLDEGTCIAYLPNGELFCLGNMGCSGNALIIDKNYKCRMLPYGIDISYSRAVYFNENVYCFGGSDYKSKNLVYLCRFNLEQNLWFISLSHFPKNEIYCNAIIFKRNILLSPYENRNLFMHSLDIDSFSVIPYEFSENKAKYLINAEERLYLIECKYGYIYESDARDEYSWTKIAESAIINEAFNMHCLYNKRGIYISTFGSERQYFKFDLDKLVLIETAYYNDNISLKKVGNKLEEINFDCENLEIDFEKYAAYFNKGYTLSNLGEKLTEIFFKEQANPNCQDTYKYMILGYAWHELDNHKAIKYFNKMLTLSPYDDKAYIGKGYAFHDMNKNPEALKYYNMAIKLNPDCFVWLCYRACVLNDIGREAESTEDFNKALLLSKSSCSDDCLYIIKMLCSMQKSLIEFKEELYKIKEKSKENQKIVNEVEEVVRKQHSRLLIRAVRCLDERANTSHEEMERVKSEIKKHQEKLNNFAALHSIESKIL